ncbi:MAG: pyridoxal-phosphate dependent enzyme [Acidisphaera sp.]|nr:pyridoxal-phosphate dependent enzyme [Acidisphaera sp.]MBV9813829.1 pyridoxal-phosphate dependent enzyme [Acetobacteraceae bacterium]
MQNYQGIRDRIARVPRVRLALTPTPLQEAPNLTRALGGPRILIKRDDLTGVAFGGNKLRNLEFRLAHALQDEPDTIIVGLDIQSNSARQTAGACNKLGLHTVLVLQGERPARVQGNLLVDVVLGAEIIFAPTRAAQRLAMDEAAARCRARGGRPHVLNDNPMFEVASALAYLETTLELLDQLDAKGETVQAVYMCSSGKGHAGLLLGQKLTQLPFAVCGVAATFEHEVPARTAAIANQTLARLQLAADVTAAEVANEGRFVGDGYGIPSDAAMQAIRLFAHTEGVILDPVYTGKAAAAMIAHIRERRFRDTDTVVFVHTGGTPAIFTWSELWDEHRDTPHAGPAMGAASG